METNIPGLFACGDITGTPYQYIKAAGQGNVAALSAVSYLNRKKETCDDVCLGRKEVCERPCISNAGYGMIRRSEFKEKSRRQL